MALDGRASGRDLSRRLVRSAGIYAGVFFAGAVVAFAYSYGPLHSAESWKIGYLEQRLTARSEQISDLEKELAQVRGEASRRADPETLERLQKKLGRSDETIGDLERKLARAKRRARDFERSRDSWKARHAEAESKLAALAAEIEKAPPPAADDASFPLPAAPAPSAGSESLDAASEPPRPAE